MYLQENCNLQVSKNVFPQKHRFPFAQPQLPQLQMVYSMVTNYKFTSNITVISTQILKLNIPVDNSVILS